MEDLQNFAPIVLLHYFDSRDNSGAKTSYQGFLLSVLEQVAFDQDHIHTGLKGLYQDCKRGRLTPVISQLEHTLNIIMNGMNQGFIVLDAFDECDKAAQAQVQKWVVAMSGNFSSVFTSRHPPLGKMADTAHIITLVECSSGFHDDISTYLEINLQEMDFDEGLQAEVVETLMQDSQGV